MSNERFVSIDAFRGLTIAAMILVNNPGSWSFIYPPLRHAAWHGWTPTDLISPFFLFIVGMSIAVALARRMEKTGNRPGLILKIVKRSAIIFALGLFLHLFPKFHFSTMRIPGVLQRIALCYLFGAVIFLFLRTKARIALSAALLLGYWALLTFIPVPGYGPGVLEQSGNLAGYVDTKLLSGHIHKPDFDPEGLLSTIPAIATVLLGTLLGEWLRSSRTINRKTIGMVSIGVLLTASGLLLHPVFPINKPLWTSSYVLFTAGMALLVFGVCFIIIEAARWKKWAWPFLVLGANAIAVFVGSTLMVKLLLLIKIPDGGGTVSPITYLYTHVLSPLAGPMPGSLIYPILLLIFWIAVMAPLYKYKIFIKV